MEAAEARLKVDTYMLPIYIALIFNLNSNVEDKPSRGPALSRPPRRLQRPLQLQPRRCHLQVYALPHPGKKRSWNPEEDAYLIKLVQKYGAQKWTTISENLPGRDVFRKVVSASSAERGGTII